MCTVDGLNINTNIVNKSSEQPHDRHQMVKKSELQIWSLRIAGVRGISARNCLLPFLKHDQSTQYD